MKQYAAIGFIVLVALLASAVGCRKTVIDGRVMAASLLEALAEQDPEIVRVECDGEIPIERDGASFVCTLYGRPGDQTDVGYVMARDGSLRTTPFVSRKRRP